MNKPPIQSPLPPYGRLVGANIKALRKARRLTQYQLADATGLSRATIAALEGGKYESVELKTIGALARVLTVTEEALIRLPNPPEGPEIGSFRRSTWFQALDPTAPELRWLAQIASVFWTEDLVATPKAVADLLDLRRRHSVAPKSD